MQLYNRGLSSDFRDERVENAQSDFIDIDGLISAARRQWPVVVLCGAIAGMFGLAYVFTVVPLYTSSVSVLIDRSNSQVVEQLSTIGSVLDDEGSVLSQVELLKSDTIALGVVDRLALANNNSFMAGGESVASTLKSLVKSVVNVSDWFGSVEAVELDNDAIRLGAAAKLVSNMDVARVGRTYVLEISYTSPFPAQAAEIANAIGEAYLVDKLNSKYDATRRASTWLQARISELRSKALQADLAVQRFRSSNGLVAAGNVLLSDQQLTELTTALITSQSDTAKARARLERIEQIIASGQTDAIVTDVLGSSISNDLRKKYLDASKLQSEISARLGPQHIQAVKLRSEMAEYQRLMFDELNRIAQSYRSDATVAEARAKSLEDSLAQATGVSAAAGETQVQLRELERESETYRNLYQTFLQRYQEAVQQQSFPVTDARVITQATPANAPSHPQKILLLGLFGVLGGALGCGFGAFREFRDRFFRTGDQVRDTLGLEFLGIAPIISATGKTATKIDLNAQTIRSTSNVSNYVINHPMSGFAETMRSAKIASDLAFAGKSCKIIGVTSALPGEGKSSISINFAQLLASQGARTVLIDADLRNPGATRSMGMHAQRGLLETLLEGQDPRQNLMHDPKTNLAFLPSLVRHRVPHSSELLASVVMQDILKTLSSEYEYIIVDLPPLGPVVDARAIANRIDGFLFVVEWGKTARRVVRQILETEERIAQKSLGVVLNKVDQEKMKLYRMYGSSEYYASAYAKYYQEEA